MSSEKKSQNFQDAHQTLIVKHIQYSSAFLFHKKIPFNIPCKNFVEGHQQMLPYLTAFNYIYKYLLFSPSLSDSGFINCTLNLVCFCRAVRRAPPQGHRQTQR